MIKKKIIIELETRKCIYQFILKYPGLHFRELSRKLRIPISTLNYHLKYLEKRGLITAKPEGKYTLYYVSNKIGNSQKKMLHLLRQETPRNIILYLLLSACASRIELSRSLEKHPTTIKLHLKKLLDMDIIEPAAVNDGEVHVKHGSIKIVERTPVGTEIIYRLKDVHSIEDSVILYKKRTLDDTFCDILSVYHKHWDSFDWSGAKMRSIKDVMESLEEMGYEIFPHPYHV